MFAKRLITFVLVFIILSTLVLPGAMATHADGLSPDAFTPCGPSSDPRPC